MLEVSLYKAFFPLHMAVEVSQVEKDREVN